MQGLADKPIVTVWNKIDLAPDRKEFLKFEVNTTFTGIIEERSFSPPATD